MRLQLVQLSPILVVLILFPVFNAVVLAHFFLKVLPSHTIMPLQQLDLLLFEAFLLGTVEQLVLLVPVDPGGVHD